MATKTTTPNYWGWLFATGILLIIIGIFAVSAPFAATFASVLVLGWFLIIGGVIELISAFSFRHSKGFIVYLLLALFSILVGVLMVMNPSITALTLTMLFALFFLTLGIFRIISSAVLRYENWGWFFLSGVLALILGILILVHWPSSALWVIGLFIGIEFIFSGWSTLMLSLFVKKLQK